MIAALYVLRDGHYAGLPDVDPWDEARDARLYDGPHPVVAHPPCARWGRYWYGGPTARVRRTLGDDGGCFAAALASVRRWGGVLEHPEASHAWLHHELAAPPRAGGWVPADRHPLLECCGGWTCCVEQGHYGHRARKATWLYVSGVAIEHLPALRWGASQDRVEVDDAHARGRAIYTRTPAGMSADDRAARREYLRWRYEQTGGGVCAPEYMGRRERLLTPEPFRDLLLGIARLVQDRGGQREDTDRARHDRGT